VLGYIKMERGSIDSTGDPFAFLQG